MRWLALTLAAVGAVFLHSTFNATSGGNPLPPVTGAVTAVWLFGGLALLALAPRAARDFPAPSYSRSRSTAVVLGVGVGFALMCLIGALVLLRIPFFEGWVRSALQTADTARVTVFVVALVTGAAEEVFFRLGLRVAIPQRWFVVGTTALYALVTAATGNLALVVAGTMLGFVAAETYRRVGHWYAPIVVHALWTTAVIGMLPVLAG